jgi:tetratricopeptide (TPR) repeat protein
VTVKDVSANAHLAAAMRLYQKLDLDAALAELQLAEVDAKDSQDQMVQVLIYRGLIYSETGKLSDASDQFKRALAIQPWAEIPADTSPRIAKNFSDARRSLWGMASVRPPQKRTAPPAAPPADPQAAPAADKK